MITIDDCDDFLDKLTLFLESQQHSTQMAITTTDLNAWKNSIEDYEMFAYLFGDLQEDGTLTEGVLVAYINDKYKFRPEAKLWSYDFLAHLAYVYLEKDGSDEESRKNSQETIEIVEQMIGHYQDFSQIQNLADTLNTSNIA